MSFSSTTCCFTVSNAAFEVIILWAFSLCLFISIETLDLPISDKGEYNSIDGSFADIEFEPSKAITTAINRRINISVILKVLLWGLLELLAFFTFFLLYVLLFEDVILDAFFAFWFSYCKRVCCNSLKTSVNCRLSVSK